MFYPACCTCPPAFSCVRRLLPLLFHIHTWAPHTGHSCVYWHGDKALSLTWFIRSCRYPTCSAIAFQVQVSACWVSHSGQMNGNQPPLTCNIYTYIYMLIHYRPGCFVSLSKRNCKVLSCEISAMIIIINFTSRSALGISLHLLHLFSLFLPCSFISYFLPTSLSRSLVMLSTVISQVFQICQTTHWCTRKFYLPHQWLISHVPPQ